MPVLGHAFVGLAIGVSTRPSARRHSEPPGIAVTSVLVVALAYTRAVAKGVTPALLPSLSTSS